MANLKADPYDGEVTDMSVLPKFRPALLDTILPEELKVWLA